VALGNWLDEGTHMTTEEIMAMINAQRAQRAMGASLGDRLAMGGAGTTMPTPSGATAPVYPMPIGMSGGGGGGGGGSGSSAYYAPGTNVYNPQNFPGFAGPTAPHAPATAPYSPAPPWLGALPGMSGPMPPLYQFKPWQPAAQMPGITGLLGRYYGA
jgi:hypothetical protein